MYVCMCACVHVCMSACVHMGQAVIVNGNSRWCNYYVEGVRWVLRHLQLDGIYLDGIRFPRATSQAHARTHTHARPLPTVTTSTYRVL